MLQEMSVSFREKVLGKDGVSADWLRDGTRSVPSSLEFPTRFKKHLQLKLKIEPRSLYRLSR